MKHRTIQEIYKSAHTYAEFDLVPNKESTIQAMEMYAEQDACEFFKWDGHEKFEGNTVEELYKIYSEFKNNS